MEALQTAALWTTSFHTVPEHNWSLDASLHEWARFVMNPSSHLWPIVDACLLLSNCWTCLVLCDEYNAQPVLSKSGHHFWNPRRACFGLSMCRQPLFVGDLDAVLDKSSQAYTREGRSRDTRLALCGASCCRPECKNGISCYYLFFLCVPRKEQLVYLSCFASSSTSKTKSRAMRELLLCRSIWSRKAGCDWDPFSFFFFHTLVSSLLVKKGDSVAYLFNICFPCIHNAEVSKGIICL